LIEIIEDLDISRPIHFIGIGGCGMSGIAMAMRRMGYAISGSDMTQSAAVDRLRDEGAIVAIGHNGGSIPADAQLVVSSAAIKPDNPEYMAAEAREIPIIKYAKMLGVFMRSRTGIAIAGTHGKTTTTAMVTMALRDLGCDPSFVIGGDVPQLGGGSGVGSSEYLVAEACEYDRSFLNLYPRYAVINNIEEDHLDYYSGLDEIVGAFRDFAMRVPADGLLVYSASSPNIARFVVEARCRTVSCALEREADYWADDIHFRKGRSLYRLHTRKTPDGSIASCDVALNTFGRHNVVNSLVAIALVHQIGLDRAEKTGAHEAGVPSAGAPGAGVPGAKADEPQACGSGPGGRSFPLKKIADAVGRFRGVRRRFEIVFEGDGLCIVDDYAHHPTAVQTVLKSSRAFFKGRRVVVVFQPHQHSRTRFLLKDFARSFRYADLVVVPDIYFVRDSQKEREIIHARDLVREIVGNNGNAIYIPSFTEIEQFLANNLHKDDVLITMGAGNVWQIGAHLAEKMGGKKN